MRAPILRTAVAADATAIAALHAASWRSAYANAMRADYLAGPIIEERRLDWQNRFAERRDMHVMICEVDGEPRGFVCTFAPDGDPHGAYLNNLHVMPDMKRRGLGSLLIRSSADWVATNFPGNGLYLFVLKVNKPAQKFYDRMGGKLLGEEYGDLPDGSKLINYRYHWKRPDLLAKGEA